MNRVYRAHLSAELAPLAAVLSADSCARLCFLSFSPSGLTKQASSLICTSQAVLWLLFQKYVTLFISATERLDTATFMLLTGNGEVSYMEALNGVSTGICVG